MVFFNFTASAELLPPEIDQNPLFQLEPSGTCFKETLLRQVPHVGTHLTSSFVGFPTLEKRRRKDAPNLSSPSPNVRRDKISRSGEPLTLI